MTVTPTYDDAPRTGYVCPLHSFERVRPFGRGSTCPRCVRDQQARADARRRESRQRQADARAARELREARQ